VLTKTRALVTMAPLASKERPAGVEEARKMSAMVA